MTACCILGLRLRLLPCFLPSTSSRIKHFLYLPTMIQWANIFIIPHESLKDCFLRKKVAEFVCSLYIASLTQLWWVYERAQWKAPLTCSGYAAALVEWPRFDWLHTSGLGGLWDYKGHRWEWGSGVQWLASDPVHSVIREPYREAPYTSDFQSCVNVWAEDWDKCSDVRRVVCKIPPRARTLFPARASWWEKKRKKKKKRRSREAEEKAKIARCINLHCPATSPQECVFVTDHAGWWPTRSFRRFPPQGWHKAPQLKDDNRPFLFLRDARWWKVIAFECVA